MNRPCITGGSKKMIEAPAFTSLEHPFKLCDAGRALRVVHRRENQHIALSGQLLRVGHSLLVEEGLDSVGRVDDDQFPDWRDLWCVEHVERVGIRRFKTALAGKVHRQLTCPTEAVRQREIGFEDGRDALPGLRLNQD